MMMMKNDDVSNKNYSKNKETIIIMIMSKK